MENKRVFFVATTPPFSFGGGAQATRAYLDATLDFYGCENVTIMLFEDIEIPIEYKDLKFVRVPQLSTIKQILMFLRGHLSRLTSALLSYIKMHQDYYDICIINGGTVGGRVIKYINKLGIKTITIHHNYEVEFCRDNKAKGTFGGKYMRIVRKLEKNSYKYSNLNLFLTKQDVILLENAYGKTLGLNVVIGTFDYKSRAKEKLFDNKKEYDITISGSLINYQTTVGVSDFYYRYFPIAKKIIPNLKVLLTGRNPSNEIKLMQRSNPESLSIIANPEDILSVVQRGKVYVCPICIGGGLKLRAMDGLKCGMPILVHEVSARGYDYYFDKPYFKIYHDEQSFRKGLEDLIVYIKENPNCYSVINNDYYGYFGYSEGFDRYKKALQSLM